MLLWLARVAPALFVACTGLLAATGAGAQQAGTETHWICWYNNDTTVRCVLRQAAPDSDLAERQVKIAQPTASARPLPRNVLRIIRAAEDLLGAEILVPLFTEPEDPLFVEQLAQFTMCYGKPACRVSFLAQRIALALAP